MTDSMQPNAVSAEPRVVIHIGWHKSASTFLQEGLFRALGANFQPLAAIPVRMAGKIGEFGSLIDFVESAEAFDAELFREMVGSLDSNDLTIISQEELSGHSHGYPLIDPIVTARNLAPAFPHARIIAITRNQFDYILSLYCYRVTIRGHESRSLARFVNEDLAEGLLKHVQYDRVVGEYVRLFGADNVLVLPMEMLRVNQEEFFDRLVAFIGRAPVKGIEHTRVNVSTRTAFVVTLWRPLNAIFATGMRLLLVLQGKHPADYAPQRQKIYPFLRARYRYYGFKRRATGLLTRWFPKARRLTADDIPDRERLEAVIAASNARLIALNVVDWDMSKFGYPVDKAKVDGHDAEPIEFRDGAIGETS